VGTFAIVFVLPEDINLTSGSARHHRSFLDIYLSQFSPKYLSDLMVYHRVLRQRNALLKKLKKGDHSEKQQHLDIWDESLLKPALAIMAARAAFIREISPRAKEFARKISVTDDTVEISYIPSMKTADLTDAKAVSLVLKKERTRDIRMAATVIGPHRDLIEIKLGGEPLRNFGSLGQKKSVMIALKLAAFSILSERRGEPAILIMDEAFATLDKNRSEALLGLLAGLGQVFLASTSISDFSGFSDSRIYDIISGSVIERQV
jgi:DNA replication and repair protein RecF